VIHFTAKNRSYAFEALSREYAFSARSIIYNFNADAAADRPVESYIVDTAGDQILDTMGRPIVSTVPGA